MSNGRHLILDLYDCDQEILDNYDQLSELLETALRMANATILRIIGEKFKPQGVTLLALLSESHASIHTWPEIGYAAIRGERDNAINYSFNLCIVNLRTFRLNE